MNKWILTYTKAFFGKTNSQGWLRFFKEKKREKKGQTCGIGFQLVDSHQ
jgi:hypothetical protein